MLLTQRFRLAMSYLLCDLEIGNSLFVIFMPILSLYLVSTKSVNAALLTCILEHQVVIFFV